MTPAILTKPVSAPLDNSCRLASGDRRRLGAFQVQLDAYYATRYGCSRYALRFARGRNDILASSRKARDQSFANSARPAGHHHPTIAAFCISLSQSILAIVCVAR